MLVLKIIMLHILSPSPLVIRRIRGRLAMNVRLLSVKLSAATTAPSLAARKENVSVFQDSHFLSSRKMYFNISRKPLATAAALFYMYNCEAPISGKKLRKFHSVYMFPTSFSFYFHL